MNYLKTTTYVSVIAITMLMACKNSNTVSDSKSMKSAESIKTIKEKMITAFGADRLVYSTSFRAKDHMSDEFMYADVSYLDKGVDMSQNFTVFPEEKTSTPKPKAMQNELILKNKQGAVALNNLNFDQIPAKVKEAELIIPAEYEDFHLNKWTFEINNDKKVTANFMIEVAKKGEESEGSGRMEVANYYEINFKMDENGKVTIVN